MNKNLFLAIALSFLIMVTWSRLTKKLYPIDTQDVTKKMSQPQAQPQAQPLPPPVISKEAIDQEQALVSARTNNREFVFSLPSACLQKVIFTNMNDHTLSLETGFCFAGQF